MSKEIACPKCNGHKLLRSERGIFEIKCDECGGVGVLNPEPGYTYTNLHTGGRVEKWERLANEGFEIVADMGNEVVARRKVNKE